MLRAVRDKVVPHLTSFFNKPFDIRGISSNWKEATFNSIFKKGDRHHLPGNCRPISLISCGREGFGRCNCRQMCKSLESSKLLNDTQHGFRRQRSHLTNLITFFYSMLIEYNQSREIDILYLTFIRPSEKYLIRG